MLKPHDIATYEQLCDMIIKYGECCLIGIPGVGKTRISNHFVEEYNLNALVISPRNEINNSWQYWNTVSERGSISTITIHQFYKNFNLYTTGFDLYIFDECHCLGAEKWGKSYSKFKKLISDDCIILGLTATPNRYFDQNYAVNNVGETVFNNHIVYCISRFEAVKLGVISDAKYVCALYDLGYLAKHYSKKNMTEELRGRLDYALKNQPAIADILRKHAPKSNKKGIVFVDKIDSIDDGIEVIRKAFPEEKIWCVHSKMGKTQYRKNCEEFKNADSGFIVNVDILSEGIHHNGVNMVIMLRKTCSPTKFTQQTGRVANVDGSVIFDFAANGYSVAKLIRNSKICKTEFLGIDKGSRDEYVSDQGIVSDYMSDILDIFHEIELYNSRDKWTEEEDEFLKQNYFTMSIEDIAEHLGRTKQSCRIRANSVFGLKKRIAPLWTEEEDEFLKQNYSTMDIKEIAEHLGRSKDACIQRANSAHNLRILAPSWTEEEDEFLKQNYFTMSVKEIAEHLGRPIQSCFSRAGKFGLKKRITAPLWTEEEDEFLKQNYLTMSVREIVEHLGRSKDACRTRAHKIGVVRVTNNWTEEEDEFLKQNYSTMDIKEIAEHLGRSKQSCRLRATSVHNLRILAPSWTEEEDEFLKQNYPAMSVKEIAEHLGRTQNSCRQRLSKKLGIKKTANWTEEEDEFLKQNYSTMDIKEIAEHLGRSKDTCKCRANKVLGLRKM